MIAKLKLVPVWVFLLMMVTAPSLEAWEMPYLRPGRHRAWVAPQAYHVKRVRLGGTWQDGWLYGIRGCLERAELNALYWGVEGNWAMGSMHGYSFSGRELKSTMMDSEIEGRIGVTLATGDSICFSATPFVGAGYYRGINKFGPPSPLSVKAIDTYGFTTAGFFAKACWEGWLSVGLNIKCRDMCDAKEVVTDDPDPDMPDTVTTIGNRLQWLYEFPLCVEMCYYSFPVELGLVPFYETRHYGEHESHPVNFIDTNYFIWGLRLLVGTYF